MICKALVEDSLMEAMRTIEVGAARLSIINVGDLGFRLKDVMSVGESLWRPLYGGLFETKLTFPSQSVHLSINGSSILVDSGDYLRFSAVGGEYVVPNYKPPPTLPDQLSKLGVGNDQVDHVVITHAHYDHYSGVTTEEGGKMVPTFRRAKHFLGQGVKIVAAPGESPGHQVLKVESDGQTAYCVGDLFHHFVEVENLDWMSSWCEPAL